MGDPLYSYKSEIDDFTDEKGLQSGQFVHGFKERTRGKHLLGSRECNFLRTGLPRVQDFFFLHHRSDELMGLKPHRSWNWLLSRQEHIPACPRLGSGLIGLLIGVLLTDYSWLKN